MTICQGQQGIENDMRIEMKDMFMKELSLSREETMDMKNNTIKSPKSLVDDSVEFINSKLEKMLV